VDACEHFGFAKPPFDPLPDPEFFYDAPTHAEALATLQYAVSADKGCCVVVGESGCGKTLLARMVAMSAGRKAPVFWVHGGGQPDNATTVTVHPPGRFGRRGDGSPVGETTLDAEMRVARSPSDRPLLIVDSADELPPRGWYDLIAWLSNEIRYSKPLNVLLFGLPRLLELLAAPELVRLQQRVFRVCCLEPLSPELTREYIHTRSAAAGGEPRYVFSDATIARIGQSAQGNPAQINRLCDNALLEAYGEGRDHVAMPDVDNAFGVSLAGRLSKYRALPAPSPPPSVRPSLPPVAVAAPRCPSPAVLGAPEPAYQPVSRALAVEPEDFGEIEMRLRHFEVRLSQALRMVRRACGHEAAETVDTPPLDDDAPGVADEEPLAAQTVLVEAELCG
jgi:type II secretory pathway predicted ATPase ExeA